MIKIIVATPKGELVNQEADSIVIDGDTGQLGVLTNRLPLLTKVSKGYVKVNSDETFYIAILNGVVDFKDNVATVIAQIADLGKSIEEAFKAIEDKIENIKKLNKQKNVDFVGAEKELMRNIKEIKAAHLD